MQDFYLKAKEEEVLEKNFNFPLDYYKSDQD